MQIRFGPVLLLVASVLLPPTPAAASDLEVRVQSLGSEPTRGSVKTFGPTALTLTSGQEIPWARLVALQVLPEPKPAKKRPAHWRVWLVGGEVLRATITGPAKDGDALKLRVEDVGPVELSLDALSALEFVPANARPCYDLLESSPGEKELDVAYDARDDALRGTVLEVTDDDVALEDEREKERRLTWDRLRVLRLANEMLPAPKGAWGEVELASGTRLHTVAPPTFDGTTLTLRTHSLPEVDLRVPAQRVRAMRWRGGAFVWASDLPFTSEVITELDEDEAEGPADAGPSVGDMLRALWAVRVNRRVFIRRMGAEDVRHVCPLRVGGVAYRHGFGVYSITTIKIQLDGAYESFQCAFGLDDELATETSDATGEPARGDASAKILCDGKEVWKADSVKEGEKAVRIGPIDVRGVKELVLHVGRGSDKQSVRDRADWLDPILVRAK